jgi:hypothetical protein
VLKRVYANVRQVRRVSNQRGIEPIDVNNLTETFARLASNAFSCALERPLKPITTVPSKNHIISYFPIGRNVIGIFGYTSRVRDKKC